ncbi:MAG: DUF262 domain-containing protein [Selenomonadaceae bacterium]|nr:DUF262 domain-containing protein [Selenomonadaceae bacterium]
MLDAKKFWLHDFIAEKRTFVIPVYQRNYDWKIANCEQLFEDIVRIIETGKSHFIGTFVYLENAGADIFRELVIIDGQQRITSIILFAKALYDLTGDEDLKDDIHSTFIKHSKGERKNKCKLRPTEYDRDVFEKLMGNVPFDENNFTAQEKSSAMYRNFVFFREKIKESNYTPKEFYNATGKLTVVSIMLEEENPQEIFESLNSTGLDLTKADLIRNFLLMPLDYHLQEELYKNYWLKIEEFLRPSDNVENFLVQYLITKRKSDSVMETKKQRLSNRNLYIFFKEYFLENYHDTEPCLKDLYRYAKFFRRFIFNDETKFANLSALDKKFYELTFLLKSDNAPIILMYLLDRYEKNHFDEATFIKFVDALISLAFRAKVCGNTGITSQFAGNVLARLDKENSLDENSFWQVITFGKGRYSFPGNKDFQAALVNNNLYETIKSHGCRYMLYSLERAAHAKELPAYSEATVEHIMPQKLSGSWKDYLTTRNDLQTHERWLHTLGNLTLTAYNSELGNSDFETKKKTYADSNFSYTRALKDYSEWNSRQIQSRAKKLAAEAVNIWQLPEEFNSKSVNIGDTFNLDSDFRLLKGAKPASFYFAETEIKLPHWNRILREVVRQLYVLDRDTFRKATQMENVRKSLFPTEPTAFQIDDGFYMETGFSTEDCLTIMKVLVENFDKLGGTNFKEDIYFTLQQE